MTSVIPSPRIAAVTPVPDRPPLVEPSPLLGALNLVRDEEADLHRTSDRIRAARRQIATRTEAVRHHHIGQCLSSSPGARYDPQDCDCTGPDGQKRYLTTLGQVFDRYVASNRATRLVLMPAIDLLIEGMGRPLRRCYDCDGAGRVNRQPPCTLCRGRGLIDA